MRFGKNPPDDLEKMTFAGIARQHFNDPNRYTNEDFAEAKQNLKLIDERTYSAIKESSMQLDKHLVWLSGGALVLVANMLQSNHCSIPKNGWLLVLSFIVFGTSIIAIVTSYRKTVQSLSHIPKAQLASSKIEELMRDMKKINEKTPEAEKEAMRQKFESYFDDFKKNVAEGRSIEKWIPICNNIAYWSFVLGMTELFVFGLLNII